MKTPETITPYDYTPPFLERNPGKVPWRPIADADPDPEIRMRRSKLNEIAVVIALVSCLVGFSLGFALGHASGVNTQKIAESR